MRVHTGSVYGFSVYRFFANIPYIEGTWTPMDFGIHWDNGVTRIPLEYLGDTEGWLTVHMTLHWSRLVTMLKAFYVNKVNFKLSYNICEVHSYFHIEISYFKWYLSVLRLELTQNSVSFSVSIHSKDSTLTLWRTFLWTWPGKGH